jgi:hypothetical protein
MQKVPDLDPLREAFRSLADGASSPDTCPPSSRFWEAQRGEVSSEDARELMDHVASCPSCAQAWRLARELDDAQLAETPALERSWRRAGSIAAMAAMLLLALAAGYLFRGVSESRDPATASTGTEGSTLAAEAKLRAAETRVAALEREIAGLSAAAHINVPFIELQPEPLRGGPRAPITAEMPAGATMAVLILATDGVAARDAHRLELIDEEGRVKWSASGLRTGADGAFTAVVPASQLPAGVYRLIASVDRAAVKVTVQEYRVRIVYRPS